MSSYDLFNPNLIDIPQGNTKELDITPIDEDTMQPIVLTEGDVVLFTVVNSRGEKVIQKKLTNLDYSDPEDTSLNCVIEPADTENLLTGWYSYDCLALLAGGKTVTFIKSSPLLISKAYGKHTDTLPEIQNEPDGGDGDG